MEKKKINFRRINTIHLSDILIFDSSEDMQNYKKSSGLWKVEGLNITKGGIV